MLHVADEVEDEPAVVKLVYQDVIVFYLYLRSELVGCGLKVLEYQRSVFIQVL